MIRFLFFVIFVMFGVTIDISTSKVVYTYFYIFRGLSMKRFHLIVLKSFKRAFLRFEHSDIIFTLGT